MATRLRDLFARTRDDLRFEPTEKRVRAFLGQHLAADTTGAYLVWEPRRVVPSYAIPYADLHVELVPDPFKAAPPNGLLHTGFGFELHSTDGQAYTVHAGAMERDQAAFRPADPDLADRVVLDFDAFDRWMEEDEPIVAHPRDPFHRVDLVHGSRHVRVELDGVVLADSTRPILVFETGLPVRFYLPREDVRVALAPTEKHTWCAYKGQASYWSFEAGGREHRDLVWSYESPLRTAAEIAGRVAFFDEKVEVTVDGRRREKPSTPLAKSIVDEASTTPHRDRP